MRESKESFHFGQGNGVNDMHFLNNAPFREMMVLVQDGIFTHVSLPFSSLFGYEPEGLLGKSVLVCIAEEDREAFTDSWTSIAQGEQRKLSAIGLKADGERVHLELFVTRGAEATKSLYIISYWSDVTVQVQQTVRLNEMETRFRSAFHYASVGMAFIGLDSQFLEVNYALCEILGRTSAELRSITMLDCLLPEGHEEFLKGCRHLASYEIPVYKQELRCKQPDGTVVWCQLAVRAIRDGSVNGHYFHIQLQDITKRKVADDLLRKSDKLSAVGRLAAGVAHEVRNPLTVLKGFAQMLNMSDSKNSHYYHLMLSEVNRIESILEEFLLLARPQETKFKTDDLCTILNQVVALMDTKAVMNKVDLKLELSEELLQLECDANQLKQVFINLIQNAIEAMPDGGTITIEASRQPHDTVKIRIRDQGCGIPADQIARLGEPFYTSKDKGTGLGLVVCFQIIEKHKGRIHIKSELNVGTTFDILLPVRQSGYSDHE